MDYKPLFETALSIKKPWYIKDVRVDGNKKRFDVFIGFAPETSSRDSLCGENVHYTIIDTLEKTWRYCDFFLHSCYLHCKAPVVALGRDQYKIIYPSGTVLKPRGDSSAALMN